MSPLPVWLQHPATDEQLADKILAWIETLRTGLRLRPTLRTTPLPCSPMRPKQPSST